MQGQTKSRFPLPRKPLWAGFWVLLAVCCIGLLYQAQAAGASFAIALDLPKNQAAGQTAYYDLTLLPGERLSLSLSVANRGEQPLTVCAQAVSSYTDATGRIAYRENSDPAGPFESLARVGTETLTLGPLQQDKVWLELDIPEGAVGEVLGALVVRQQPPEQAQAGVTNTLAYTVGVLLRIGEPADAAFALEAPGMDPDVLHLPIVNQAPVLVKGLAVEVWLQAETDQEPVLLWQGQGLDITPASTLPLTVVLSDPPVPGSYTLLVTLSYREQTWRYAQALSIP